MPVPEQGKIQGRVLIEGVGVPRHVLAFTHELQTLDDGYGGTYQGRKVVGDTVSAADGTYTLQFDYTGEVVVVAMPDYGQIYQNEFYYDPGARIRPTIGQETGYVYECTVPGESGATEPVWWIDEGGGTLGSVGAATFKAVESWWPVSHAPIKPDIIVLSYSNLQYNHSQDPYAASVVSLLNFNGNPASAIVDEIPGNTWTLVGDADQDGLGALILDGDGDYVQHTDSPAFRNQFNGISSSNWTLELGIVIGQNTADAQVLDWRPDTTFKGINIVQPASNPTTLKLEAGDNSGGAYEVEVVSSEGYVPGQLVEAAITRNGDDYLFHCRGIYMGKASTPLALDLGTGGIRIGEGRNPGTINGFNSKAVRFRATAGVSRYKEKNYLVEGDTTSYAWVDVGVLNGDFASGDLTHWLYAFGAMSVSAAFADPAAADGWGFTGLGGSATSAIYQQFLVPADALMLNLSCFLGRNFADPDQAGVGVAFLDIFEDQILGSGNILSTDGANVVQTWEKNASCMVPPGAHYVQIIPFVNREGGSVLNAGGDSVVARWLTGDFFPHLEPVPFVNADFYMGTMAGWTTVTGSPFVAAGGGLNTTSDYSARAPSGTSVSFSQEITIPSGVWKHAVLTLSGSTDKASRDNCQCDFVFKDISGTPLVYWTVRGTRGIGGRFDSSEVVEIPAASHSVEAVVRIVLEVPGAVNAACAGVKVDMIDPLPELESVIFS